MKWDKFSAAQKATLFLVAVAVLIFAAVEVKEYMFFRSFETKPLTVEIDAVTGKILKVSDKNLKGRFPTADELFRDRANLDSGKTNATLVVKFKQDPGSDYEDREDRFEIARFGSANHDFDGTYVASHDRRDLVRAQIAAYPDFVRKATAHIPRVRYIFLLVDKTEKSGPKHQEFVQSQFNLDKLCEELKTTGDGVDLVFAKLTGEYRPIATRVTIPIPKQPQTVCDAQRSELEKQLAWVSEPSKTGESRSVLFPALFNLVSMSMRDAKVPQSLWAVVQIEIHVVSDAIENSSELTNIRLYDGDGDELTPEQQAKMDKALEKFSPPELGEHASLYWVAPPDAKPVKTVRKALKYAAHVATGKLLIDPDNVRTEFGAIIRSKEQTDLVL